MFSKNTHNDPDFWNIQSAAPVTVFDKTILFALFCCGIGAVGNFALWWFQAEHIGTVWLYGLLSFILWYGILRTVFTWYTYLNIAKPGVPKAPEQASVAIFTTSYKGEPLEMVRKTLEACAAVSYPHTTYLLDNTEDPAFKNAAEATGAVWLELVDIPGAKAGKVNRALEMTSEEFILILDPDHLPHPQFFEQTLGYFNDPGVGFVQVSQGYYNQNRSFIATAAAQQTYTFYGATQMGYHGLGCAIAIGANCTFRRKAFESIGGHVEGLAEDLQTSLRLHAQGWKSVYNPVIANRGIVPEDFNSFAKQQLKWAFGTFGVLYNDLPKLFGKLRFHQKLTYLSIATYYFSGFITLVFVLLPFLYVTTGQIPVDMSLSGFMVNGAWIVLVSVLFYLYAQKWMCHPRSERGIHWQSMILKFATWPVFLYGLYLALANIAIPYIPTAKRAERQRSVFAKPLYLYILVFVLSFFTLVVYRMYWIDPGSLVLSSATTWVMMAFAGIIFILSLISMLAIKPPKKQSNADPWDGI